MSLKLTYRVATARFRREIAASAKKVFGVELGASYVYPVAASFRDSGEWTPPFLMLYDTGAAVSLLPFRFYDLLGVEKSAPAPLMGVVPGVELQTRLARTTMRLQDAYGMESEPFQAWVTIAERDDVPLVLGLKDVADTHKLIVDVKKGEFYLEFY